MDLVTLTFELLTLKLVCLEHTLLLLVTSTSDLSMRTNKLCSVLFGVTVD